MAETYFNFIVKQKKAEDSFQAFSAGIQTGDGYPASGVSNKILKELGIALSDHRSRQINPDMMNEADLVLAMTGEQKKRILEWFPQHREKIFMLTEFCGEKGDIPDPIGLDEKTYRQIFDKITRLVNEVLKKIEAYDNENRARK